jgi:hypothetical protein
MLSMLPNTIGYVGGYEAKGHLQAAVLISIEKPKENLCRVVTDENSFDYK